MSLKLTNKQKYLLTAAGGLALAGAGAYLYASKIESRRYQLERVRVITGDGNAWRHRRRGNGNGQTQAPQEPAKRVFKILHLSDLHLKHPESHKIEFIQSITSQTYDLIVLTGDVFEDMSGLKYAKYLLASKPKFGAYAVLGNHDYYDYTFFHKIVGRLIKRFRHPPEMRDVQPMVESLQDAGFEVLRNESRSLHEHGLHIVGVDYPGIQQERLIELAAKAEDDDLILALFHMPRNLHFYSRAGVHLALGGHTHGGQIRIPGVGPLITDSELPRKEASGLVRRGNTTLHISRGLGADPRSNIRLFCPPAATILEVHHQG